MIAILTLPPSNMPVIGISYIGEIDNELDLKNDFIKIKNALKMLEIFQGRGAALQMVQDSVLTLDSDDCILMDSKKFISVRVLTKSRSDQEHEKQYFDVIQSIKAARSNITIANTNDIKNLSNIITG